MIKPFFIFIFFIQITHQLKADDKTPIKEEHSNLEKNMIRANEAASSRLDNLTHRLDIFLSGETYTNKTNKSTVTLKNAAYWQEGNREDIDLKSHFDLRVHLPNLESKWALRFTSYDEDTDERGINRVRPKTEPVKENYGASLAVLETFGDVDFSFRPRLKIKENPETAHLIKIQTKGRFTRFTLKPRLELFARSDVGTGQLAALDFDIPLSESFLFTVTNEQEYVDNQNILSTNNEFALRHSLSDNQSLKYALLYECNNKPNFHLFEYVVSASYSHSIYKNIMHYNVVPRLIFNENKSFRPLLTAEVGLDFIF